MLAGTLRKSVDFAALALAGALAFTPLSAEARGWHGGYWHGGHWHVGFYSPIVVGGPYWYGYGPGPWYDPYYYAPPPATTVVVAPPAQAPAMVTPPPAASYYYCDNPAGYYPHVSVCSVPFRPVAIPQR
jgi:hypothetical protein